MDALSIINYGLEVIIYLATGYVLFRLSQLFVPLRNNQAFGIISYIGLTVIGAIPIMISETVNISYVFLGFIILMILCYEGLLLKKLSVVVILYPIIISSFIIGKYLVSYFLSDLCRFIILGLLYRMIKDKIKDHMLYLDRKTLLLTDCICTASFISVIIMPIVSAFNEWGQVFIVACACLITNVGILLLISYLTEGTKIYVESKYYKLQHEYYRVLEEKQLEVRKIHHDMNNHLQLLNNYLVNKNYEEAHNYLDEICNISTKINIKTFSKNSLLNALINSKYETMLINEIECYIHIDINEITEIDNIDLCTLFANTIDNSIEASLKIKNPAKRRIVVKARVEKGYFSYSISNTKENKIIDDHGVLETSKPDSEHHGFGLLSVRDIVNKYHGSIDISYTNSDFTLVIIIKLA